MPPETDKSPHPDRGDESWQEVVRHALALAAALRAVAGEQAHSAASACQAYAGVVDAIVRVAKARGKDPSAHRMILTGAPTPQQLVDFGRLLRDKRNQAGFSRVQLARKAKVSDATVKFAETARHPPSRQTLIRLVGVPELGLDWSDTPGYCAVTAPPNSERADAPVAAGLNRLDSRLTVPMVLEALLVLDELHACLNLVEITAHGARRACIVCGMRSDAWVVDARQAAKLPIHHAAPCAGQLAESLCQRHPVIAELAQDERRAEQSEAAIELAASRQATQVDRFLGCRSGREVAAQLARAASLPPSPFRKGVSELLLWALEMGPCPVEPTTDAFTERRARQIAEIVSQPRGVSGAEAHRLRGISDAAEWLVSSTAEPPCDAEPGGTGPCPVLPPSRPLSRAQA